MIPRPWAAAFIARNGTDLVPDPVEPDPAPGPAPVVNAMLDAPCGFCEHPRRNHGTRYSAFGGSHEWLRRHPGSHATSLHPFPISEETPDD